MLYRYETPFRELLAHELFDFWVEIFGPIDPDVPISVFLGEEADHNDHVVFVERDEDLVVSTCGITFSRADNRFAGISDVATRPSYRGRGIAGSLCLQALEEFTAKRGEVLFLGTMDPDVARIYHRLGWRRIAGANLWANVTTGDSPEEYLVDHFRSPAPIHIVKGDPSLRIPMIPLLLTPHDWQVLDGNLPTPMISTRYERQNSCMGLCRKYYYLLSPLSPREGGRERAQRDGRGMLAAEWFAAKTSDQRLVGIGTAWIDAENVCNVDGFIHKRFNDSYKLLIDAAIEWGRERNATRFAARICTEDIEKRALFGDFGFQTGPIDGTFTISGRDVLAVSMLLN